MRSLRRLSAVSVASLPAILLLSFVGASAQSAPTPFAQRSTAPSPFQRLIHVSPPLTFQPSAPQQIQPSANYRVLSADEMKSLIKAPGPQEPVIEAENVSPCYAMRTYGFTTPRDGASAPQMTSYKTCTPASQTHLKELVIIPQPAK